MFLLVGLLISHVSSSSKTRTSLTLSPSCSLIYSRVKGPPPVAVSLAPLTNGVRIGETSVPAGGGLLGLQPPAHSFTLLCICYLHNLFHVGTSPCACLSTVLQLAIMHLPPPVDSAGDTRQHNEAASWRRRVRHKPAIYHLLTTYNQQVIVDNFNSYRTRNLLKKIIILNFLYNYYILYLCYILYIIIIIIINIIIILILIFLFILYNIYYYILYYLL